MKPIAAAAVFAVLAPYAAAEGDHILPYDGSYDDALFAVENAIVNQGLVIDYVSHVGDMLNRTSGDVGGTTALFDQAQIFVFCSARVSRQVMEVDPMLIAHCPYGIFVAERGKEVLIGFRDYPEGPMDLVETLLTDIVADATAF
ncbi:MAG: DUF302 domain-containing protein [Pseudomonadota bacterium]